MPTTQAATTPTVPSSGSTVTIMTNGDAVNSNNLVIEVSPGAAPYLTLTFLWNWLIFIIGLIWPGLSLSQVSAAGTSFTRWAMAQASGYWSTYQGNAWQQTAVSPSPTQYAILSYYLDVPQGATLTSASVEIAGASGDSALPAAMPTFSLAYVGAGGTSTAIGTVTTDSSANATAYKATHTLTVSPSGGAVINNATGKVVAILTGESGTNSNTGMLAYPLSYTWTGGQIGR
jgi:hypothetical protein